MEQEMHSEPNQTSTRSLSAKAGNGWKQYWKWIRLCILPIYEKFIPDNDKRFIGLTGAQIRFEKWEEIGKLIWLLQFKQLLRIYCSWSKVLLRFILHHEKQKMCSFSFLNLSSDCWFTTSIDMNSSTSTFL